MGWINIILKISGTTVVALALFAFLSIATGVGFNQIIEGMGNVLIGIGVVVVIFLFIMAVIVIIRRS